MNAAPDVLFSFSFFPLSSIVGAAAAPDMENVCIHTVMAAQFRP